MLLELASGSPRRARTLRTLGVAFVVDPPDIDETPLPAESPAEMVVRLVMAKVGDEVGKRPRLAIDTIVVVDDAIIGIPADADEAIRTILALSGREHAVVSGWALRVRNGVRTGRVVSEVRFRKIERNQAVAYVATGEPMDKAGSYGLQGFGSRLIASVDGSLSNVMGFPVEAVVPALVAIGIDVPHAKVEIIRLRRASNGD